ncbi:MAG: N-acetyltransferase [Myxococcales bacterium]|nr:N-acetyltransferase [Myxococcales bacterium]
MSSNYFAHPSAIVDEPTQIGNGTKIWHFCHVMSGAVIGRDCILGQNVFVAGGAEIGDRVKIQNNVSVYKGCIIEDDVFLGPSCVLTNVINPRAEVERKDEFRLSRLRVGATVGANATIVCGVTIGRYAFIGAGAVVTKDVPDYALVTGVPGRQVGWTCRCGERLSSPEAGRTDCGVCGRSYRTDEAGLAELGDAS